MLVSIPMAPICGLNLIKGRAASPAPAADEAPPLPLRVRRLRPGDTPLVAELLAAISPQSFYTRFFTARSARADETERLAALICAHALPPHTTLVATVGQGRETAIALAECVLVDQAAATGEIALLVHDSYQAHGIGTVLFIWLMQYALLQSLATLRGIALGENRRVLQGLQGLRLNATTSFHHGEMWIEIGLGA
jgi:GNAT superfamily N-acetyltransferase